MGLLQNSSIYFYTVGILYVIGQSPENVAFLLVCVSLIGILGSYKLGTLIRSRTLGLVFASTLAIHPYFISSSQRLFQPVFVDALFPLVLLLSFHSFTKRSAISLFLSTVVLFFLLHMHLMLLLFLIPYLVIFIWTLIKISSLLKKILLGLTLYFCVLSLLILTGFNIPNFQSWIGKSSSQVNILETTSAGFKTVFSNISFHEQTSHTVVLTLCFLTLLIFSATRLRLGIANPYVFFSLFAFFIFFMFPQLKFGWWYIGPSLIVITFMMLLSFFDIAQSLKIPSPGIAVVCIFFSLYLFYPRLVNFIVYPGNSPQQLKREASLAIIEYLKSTYGVNNYKIKLLESSIVSKNFIYEEQFMNWTVSGYWYYLEKESGLSLVHPCPGEYNLCIDPNKKIVFLICLKSDDCLKLIIKDIGEDSDYYRERLSIDPSLLNDERKRHTVPLYSDKIRNDFQIYALHDEL